MSLYVLLHVLFGLVAGLTLTYLKTARNITRIKAWLGYLAGVSVCLAIAAIIGNLSRQWEVIDFYKWIGAGSVPVSFATTILLTRLIFKARKAD